MAQLCGRGLEAGIGPGPLLQAERLPAPPAEPGTCSVPRGRRHSLWKLPPMVRLPWLWAALPPCPPWPGLAWPAGAPGGRKGDVVYVTRPCDRPLGGHILSFWGWAGPCSCVTSRGLATGERGFWPRLCLRHPCGQIPGGLSRRAGAGPCGRLSAAHAAPGWQSAPSWALGSVHRRRSGPACCPRCPSGKWPGRGAAHVGAHVRVCVCVHVCVRVPIPRRLPTLAPGGTPGHQVHGGLLRRAPWAHCAAAHPGQQSRVSVT